MTLKNKDDWFYDDMLNLFAELAAVDPCSAIHDVLNWATEQSASPVIVSKVLDIVNHGQLSCVTVTKFIKSVWHRKIIILKVFWLFTEDRKNVKPSNICEKKPAVSFTSSLI